MKLVKIGSKIYNLEQLVEAKLEIRFSPLYHNWVHESSSYRYMLDIHLGLILLKFSDGTEVWVEGKAGFEYEYRCKNLNSDEWDVSWMEPEIIGPVIELILKNNPDSKFTKMYNLLFTQCDI